MAAGEACDWCGGPPVEGGGHWLMGPLSHPMTVSKVDLGETIEKPPRRLWACPECAPLVRAHDFDGLAERSGWRALPEGETTYLDKVFIYRSIDRALITEIDPSRRPTAEEREAFALAGGTTPALAELGASGRGRGAAPKAAG